eukprot:6484985-Amphidinium_carterae.1
MTKRGHECKEGVCSHVRRNHGKFETLAHYPKMHQNGNDLSPQGRNPRAMNIISCNTVPVPASKQARTACTTLLALIPATGTTELINLEKREDSLGNVQVGKQGRHKSDKTCSGVDTTNHTWLLGLKHCNEQLENAQHYLGSLISHGLLLASPREVKLLGARQSRIIPVELSAIDVQPWGGDILPRIPSTSGWMQKRVYSQQCEASKDFQMV